jgi:hypothetical protein
MKGDFSRDSFDRQKPFSRVMMQQGRVQIDADWNEQTSLTLAYARTLAADLLGKGAGPARYCGFRIATEADLAPPASGAADPFTPEEREALKKNASALKKGDLLLLPGRYYVGGIAIELGAPTLYSGQIGYPFDEATKAEVLNDVASWLAYLDVWEEFVSAEQDGSIAEPALGGVDTCGRALIRWQVRVLIEPEKGEDGLEVLESHVSGSLTARTDEAKVPKSPCIIPPDSRYRGVENQLYRVEIHRGSDASGEGATFKWSRDNGSIVFPVKHINDQLLELDHLGRDERSGLAKEKWVELVDDSATGRDPGGQLAQIVEVKRDERALVVDWAATLTSAPLETSLAGGLRPVLRRWDHQGDAKGDGAIAVRHDTEIELEDGIVIKFAAGGRYRPGDYWLIPARVASGQILWPGAKDKPEARPPDGPAHFYAPLAFFKDGKLKDLRCRFKPICIPFAEEEAPAAPGGGRTRVQPRAPGPAAPS